MLLFLIVIILDGPELFYKMTSKSNKCTFAFYFITDIVFIDVLTMAATWKFGSCYFRH